MSHPNTDQEIKEWAKLHESNITKELSDAYRLYYKDNVQYIQEEILSSTAVTIVLFLVFIFICLEFTFTLGVLGGVATYWLIKLAIKPVIVTSIKTIFRNQEYHDIVKAYIENCFREDFRNAHTEKEWDHLQYVCYACRDALKSNLPFDK